MPGTSQPFGEKSSSPFRWFRYLGPGIITAALVFGPGSLTVTSKIGALYEYQFLWSFIGASFFMIIFTEMAVRIGLAIDNTLLTVIKDRWGWWLSIPIGVGIFLVTACFQAGNTIGVGIAFGELFQTSFIPWSVFFTGIAIVLLSFPQFYKYLERTMIFLVSIMLLAFVVTLIMIRPDFSKIIPGLIPSIPKGSVLLLAASVATCFSVVAAFYQTYLVKEKKFTNQQVKQARNEAVAGIVVLGLLSIIILICAATVLHPAGITVNSAAEMATVIEPASGSFASLLFMIGLFGASFSSLVGNATIGGSILTETLGFENKLSSIRVRLLIIFVMVTGLAVAVIFGALPIQLIVLAQGLTIFVAPLIGIVLLMIANKREIMGDLKNGFLSNVFGILGLIVLFILGWSNMRTIFF